LDVGRSAFSALRKNIAGALAAGFIVIAFCGILLWRDPLVFWNDDYQLSILPVFADVARSWGEGHWPLLSPYSWVCGNLAGEYQYGTFSVFVNAAVVLIWKFPLTFPQQAAALSITHLFVLALGAFLLARERNFDIPLSIFVSLVATLNGWIICWGATDWFGALAAFAWLPWCWWALENSLRITRPSLSHHKPLTMERKRLMMGIVWPAPFVYLLVTGGFPYTVLMLALLVAWLSMKSLVETKKLMSILPMLSGVALGFAMSAPAWLALLDYTSNSARAGTAAGAHSQWLIPWRALPGFIIPAWTVNWADFSTRMMPHSATELASGLVAPVALIAAIVNRGHTFLRAIKWDFALLIIVLLLCMLPSAGVFRWSFRWLPLFHLVLALCAAHSLQDRQPRGLIALLIVGVVSIMMSIFGAAGNFAHPLTWIFLVLAAIWAALEWLERDSLVAPVITFAALLATYLCIPPNCGVPKYNLSQELLRPEPLDRHRLYLSIYPPPEFNYRVEMKKGPIGQLVRPGSTSMWAGLSFVNGYSPILPAGIAREFKCAIHGEIDPGIGYYLLHDYSGALAELGIDGLVVASEVDVDPPTSEWELAVASAEGRVFHRHGPPLARVRSVEWLDSKPDRKFAAAQISQIRESRNRVEVDVDLPNGGEPALLKFSRPFFSGYVATLNGKRLDVNSYRGLLPIVELPAGSRGNLVLSYRPAWLVWGGAIALASLLLCIVGVMIAPRFRA
jgi:hypothetical protein